MSLLKPDHLDYASGIQHVATLQVNHVQGLTILRNYPCVTKHSGREGNRVTLR